jgi:hypothetical protein
MATLNQNQLNTEQLPKRAAVEKNQIGGVENTDDTVASEPSTCNGEELERGKNKNEIRAAGPADNHRVKGGGKTKSRKRSYGRKSTNRKNWCWHWLDVPWRTKIKAGAQAENRAEQNEIRAKIHYGSRKQKWILSRKMNATNKIRKQNFPLKTKHHYNSETQRSPPSLPPSFDYWNTSLNPGSLSLI